jgi:hypothetical protein
MCDKGGEEECYEEREIEERKGKSFQGKGKGKGKEEGG